MRRRRLLAELGLLALAVGAGVLFLPRGLFGPQEPSTHVVNPAVVEATIAVGGAPVAAHVELRGRSPVVEEYFESKFRDGARIASADTGADGRVRFDDVRGEVLSLRMTLPDGRVAETWFEAPRGAPRLPSFEIPAIVSGPAIELLVKGIEPVQAGDRLLLSWERDDSSSTDEVAFIATRDSDGRYFVPRVPPGRARVVWDRPGRFTMQGDGAPLAADATSVELAIGRRDPVRGVLLAEDDVPVAGLDISIATRGENGGCYVTRTQSDARGEFAFDTFAPSGPRNFIATVFGRGYVPVIGGVRRDSPAPTTPLRPRVKRTDTLLVRVRTQDGRPIEGVELRFGTEDGDWVGGFANRGESIRTGADGRVRVEDVWARGGTVQVSGPDWVSVPSGPKGRRLSAVPSTEASEATIELVAEPARVVRGTVRDSTGKPVAGALLTATARGAANARLGMLGDDRVESDVDGTFVWRRLPRNLELSYSARHRGFKEFAARDLPDDVGVVEVTLETSRPAFTRPPATTTRKPSEHRMLAVIWKDREGRPIEGVESEAWVPGSTDAGPGITWETSEADGRFGFEADPGDEYDVVGVLRTRPDPLVGVAHLVAAAAGAPVEVPVEVVLGAPDPTRVHLVVIDGVEGAPPRSFPDAPVFEGVVKSEFEVRNGVIALPTERLKGATLVIRSADDEWGFPENIVPMRVAIDVSKGTTRVRLVAGLTITGTVVRRDGTAAANAVVKGVSKVDAFFSPKDVQAGADGRFRLEGLAPGDYAVSSTGGTRHSTPVVIAAGTKGVRLVAD